LGGNVFCAHRFNYLFVLNPQSSGEGLAGEASLGHPTQDRGIKPPFYLNITRLLPWIYFSAFLYQTPFPLLTQ
jgi:hypothetical protein